MRIDQQPDVHELVRKQRAIIIQEGSPQFECPSCRVDLAVDGFDLSRGELLLVRSIVGVHLQLSSPTDGVHDFRNRILRHVELDTDRLELRDDDERSSCIRRYVIADVHQTQTYPAIDRRRDVAVGEVYLRLVQVALVEFYCSLE